MTIQDLLHAWEQAVDDATIEQTRADETDEMLDTRSGLRAGDSGTPSSSGWFCKAISWNDGRTCQLSCGGTCNLDGWCSG